MGPKDADRMANSVDPDQTCLSENLHTLWYFRLFCLLYSCLADATEGFERMEGKNIDSSLKVQVFTQFVQDVSERK